VNGKPSTNESRDVGALACDNKSSWRHGTDCRGGGRIHLLLACHIRLGRVRREVGAVYGVRPADESERIGERPMKDQPRPVKQRVLVVRNDPDTKETIR
jgi:hypothetical protein